MGSISKGISLFLVVVLAVSSLMMVESASAQSMPKPSAPEFTIKFIDNSYDILPTATIDPYTGKTIINAGHHVENKNIEFSIRNQEWNDVYGINYNIRVKGHFEQNWTNVFSETFDSPTMSNSTYTNLVFSSSDGTTYKGFYRDWGEIYAPSEGKIDFQVQAFVRGYVPSDSMFGGMSETTLTKSDWSNTQTVTIPATSTSTSPTQNPTPTPTVPEFPSWTIPLLFSIMLATAGLLVYHKKHKPNLVKKI
jgi:hypothetical protein